MTPNMTPDEIKPFLHLLCDAAEKETMSRFRQVLDIDNKEPEDFDPVTEADREAERAIRRLIQKHYPDHGILGEEDGIENEGADYCWIIDPVDGTRSFISGLPTWGTLIGLYHKGVPIAGMIQQPFTKERYFTSGEGSFLQMGNDAAVQISTKQTTELSQSILMTTTPKLFKGEELDAYERLENACKLARYGCDCYAYAMVASGQVELVAENSLHIYDVAGIIPVVEQAGGIMTNWQGKSCANGGQVLAAANREIHGQAMELLNK